LLARLAFEESHFRPDIVSGAKRSVPGAVGLMQLLPPYFPGAGADTVIDIHTAAQFLVGLYHRFDDWQVALAAYNWGGGNVHHEYARDADKYVLADMPLETRNYVSQIIHDVPVAGALIEVQA
jgi:soluble lytic murein transglycosylase-like protein